MTIPSEAEDKEVGEIAIGVCENPRCENEIDEPNIEAWEETGKFLCADCVDELFEAENC